MSRPVSHFDELYELYFKRVYAYFFVCFGEDMAEDLSQVTFLKVWNQLCSPHGKEMDNWRAWIFRVAVNVKNDTLRKKQRTPVQTQFEERHCARVVELEPDVLQKISVEQALKKLRGEERDILLLKNSGLNSEEIAKIYGISSSAVRSRLAAARAHFQKILKEYGVICGD